MAAQDEYRWKVEADTFSPRSGAIQITLSRKIGMFSGRSLEFGCGMDGVDVVFSPVATV